MVSLFAYLHRTINIQQTKDNISVLSISTPSGIIINSPHCSLVFTFVGGHGPRIILVTFEFVAPHINLHLYLAVLFALYKRSLILADQLEVVRSSPSLVPLANSKVELYCIQKCVSYKLLYNKCKVSKTRIIEQFIN